MIKKSNIISIAGPSGVGKTTISRIIMAILGFDNTVLLSDDDLHKWERGDRNWNDYTHLNPSANNLKKGYEDVMALKEGKKIDRKIYSHKTGKFEKELVCILPHDNIIREGLLTFYEDFDKNISDITIYVDASNDLKNKWKLHRDITKRGYNLTEVIETIYRRKIDEEKYVKKQKITADILIEFDIIDDKVNLTIKSCNDNLKPFVKNIQESYNLHKDFVIASKNIGNNLMLAQNKGGNISYKTSDGLVISSSGVDFSEVEIDRNFTLCNKVGKKIINNQQKQSMEIDVHLKMPGKCTIHTHPVYLLCALCSNESKTIIKEIFDFMEYTYVEYFTPGKELAESLNKDTKNIIFAKNHGLFVSAENFNECLNTTIMINEKLKIYLTKNMQGYYMFPDAIVLKDENFLINYFIITMIKNNNLTLNPLSDKECQKLISMDAEKYRMKKI